MSQSQCLSLSVQTPIVCVNRSKPHFMKSETPNVCINSSKPLLMEFQPLLHNWGSKPLFMKSETPNVCINSSKPLFKEFQTPFHGIPNPYFRGCVCIQIQVKHTNLKYHLGNNPSTPLGKRYGSRKTSQRLWDRTSEQPSEDTFAVLN